jgi:hypothetical protein
MIKILGAVELNHASSANLHEFLIPNICKYLKYENIQNENNADQNDNILEFSTKNKENLL